jgi:hypothetical protein
LNPPLKIVIFFALIFLVCADEIRKGESKNLSKESIAFLRSFVKRVGNYFSFWKEKQKTNKGFLIAFSF